MSKKYNIILDLDNTILSCISISDKKSKLIPDLIQKFPTHYKLDEHNITKYYIFPRYNLTLFLDYIFNHFNVIVWTSASRRYCSFIISNLLDNRPVKYVFFDYHVDISNKIYNHSKHLDLLIKTFNIPSINYNNTIIIDNNSTIANQSLPYKTYCCTSFNIIKYINTYTQDDEFNNIISYLASAFYTPLINLTSNGNTTENSGFQKEIIKQSDFVKENIQLEKLEQLNKSDSTKQKYELLGWNKVESRSRPGEFSYENIHTGERIPDEPKYEASKVPEKSRDLQEYD